MKILYLTDDFPPTSFGGGGIIAHAFAKQTRAFGHHVSVITTTQTKSEEGFSYQDDLRVFKLYSNHHPRWRAYTALYNPLIVNKIAAIIKEVKPEVVHAHNVHQSLSYYSLKLARRGARRLILTAHDTMHVSYGKVRDESRVSQFRELIDNRLRYNPLRNIAIRHYLGYADSVVAVSDALRRALENNGVRNVRVIHNGINTRDWSVPAASVDSFVERNGLHGKRIVLFGGRLSGAKGGMVIMEAMRKVVRKSPEAVLVVVGKGDNYSDRMKELARSGGFTGNIKFTGWLSHDEMKVAYAACAVVVVPSLYLDPFPTVNLEAMAAKKPVIGTCFGGTPELVADGETGYILNPNNTDLMADRILDLLIDRQKAEKFGNKGFERVESEFSLEAQAEKYLSLML